MWKKKSLKKFNEGGKTLAWVIYCEMRGSVGFLQGLPCMLLKAVSDKHEAAAFPARRTASDSEKDCRTVTGWRKIKDIICH